ncbi:MAG: glutamine synthetase [Chloroflexi bacterium]|nr:glutamine synthetase [Chloroflexota bacterium]
MLERDRAAVEYVLHESRENDVKFIRLWFSETLGNLNGVAITVEELESAITRGMGFDGSSIGGFARSDECDLYALHDPNTFNIFPWRPRTNEVARKSRDVMTPDDETFEGAGDVGPETTPITKP